jgi:hypothetical protein
VAGATALGVVAGAAAGAMGVLAAAVSTAAKEVKNLARVSNVDVVNFQKLAFAAKSVGIEQDKLADIFKDSQDKIGDFLATGGGELKDFFELIAPKIGLTAEAMSDLSGPQILGKFQQALDAANLSMSEQVFFLEAIASDASLLQPLLTNNAAGFNALGREAERLNAVLSEAEIGKLADLTGGFSALAQQISTGTARAVLEFDDQIKSALEGASEGVSLLSTKFSLLFEMFRAAENKQSLIGIDNGLKSIIERRVELDKILANPNIFIYADRDEAKAELVELKAGYDELIARKKELLAPALTAGVVEPFSLAGAGAALDAPTGPVDGVDTKQAETVKFEQEENDAIVRKFRDAELEQTLAHQEQLAIIEQEKLQERRDVIKDFLDGAQGDYRNSATAITELVRSSSGRQNAIMAAGFATALQATAQHSKKAFKLNKLLTLSNAIVDGFGAATASFKWGAGIGGPPLGAAMAAASVAITSAQIKAIQSQTFGGGGGGGAVAGGGAVQAGGGAAQQQQQAADPTLVNITLEGGMFTGEQVRNLVGQINEAVDDGFKLRFT